MNWLKEKIKIDNSEKIKMDSSEAGQHYLKYADLFSKIEKNLEEHKISVTRMAEIERLQESLEIQRKEIDQQLADLRIEARVLRDKWNSKITGISSGDERFCWEMFQKFVEDLKDED